MQKGILSVLFASLISFAFSQNNECTGKMYPPPAFSDSVRKYFEAHLRSAEKKYRNDSTDDDYIIWYGRRLAYLGRYKEAIDIYSKGIKLHPGNARYYRHRGHRFITLRCFDQAIDDL